MGSLALPLYSGLMKITNAPILSIAAVVCSTGKEEIQCSAALVTIMNITTPDKGNNAPILSVAVVVCSSSTGKEEIPCCATLVTVLNITRTDEDNSLTFQSFQLLLWSVPQEKRKFRVLQL